MSGRADLGLMLAAFEVALRARVGGLERDMVHRMQAMAELSQRHRLRQSVADFAECYPNVRWDAAALSEAGTRLLRAVELATVPVPPDAERADIHG